MGHIGRRFPRTTQQADGVDGGSYIAVCFSFSCCVSGLLLEYLLCFLSVRFVCKISDEQFLYHIGMLCFELLEYRKTSYNVTLIQVYAMAGVFPPSLYVSPQKEKRSKESRKENKDATES